MPRFQLMALDSMAAGAVAFTLAAPSLRPIRKISLDRPNRAAGRPERAAGALQGWARAFLREGL